MRKFLTVLLSFLITFCCLTSPAFAAGEALSFSDVPADAWYTPYIEVCAQAGVMGGVGEGRFEPERPLSQVEAYVLLLRLHDVLQGGDGVFPQPPEDWGTALLTFDDGTQFTLSANTVVRIGIGIGGDSSSYSFNMAIFSPEELAALEACAGQYPIITEPATGATARVTWIDSDYIRLHDPYNVAFDMANLDFDHSFGFATASFCPDWYRRAAWYARTHELWAAREPFPNFYQFSLSSWCFLVEQDEYSYPLGNYAMSDGFGLAVLELSGSTQELWERLTQCGLSLGSWPAPRRSWAYSPITRAQAATVIALTLDPTLPVVSVLPTPEK